MNIFCFMTVTIMAQLAYANDKARKKVRDRMIAITSAWKVARKYDKNYNEEFPDLPSAKHHEEKDPLEKKDSTQLTQEEKRYLRQKHRQQKQNAKRNVGRLEVSQPASNRFLSNKKIVMSEEEAAIDNRLILISEANATHKNKRRERALLLPDGTKCILPKLRFPMNLDRCPMCLRKYDTFVSIMCAAKPTPNSTIRLTQDVVTNALMPFILEPGITNVPADAVILHDRMKHTDKPCHVCVKCLDHLMYTEICDIYNRDTNTIYRCYHCMRNNNLPYYIRHKMYNSYNTKYLWKMYNRSFSKNGCSCGKCMFCIFR